jgi:hypothetical protein
VGKRFFISNAKYKPLGPPPMQSTVSEEGWGAGREEVIAGIMNNLNLNYLFVKCLGFIPAKATQLIRLSGHRHRVGSESLQCLQSLNKRETTLSWLDRFLNTAPRGNEVPSPSTGFFDIEGQPVPLSLASQDVRAARELIRAAAVRTAAIFGIPANWMSYEVVTISDDEKAYFQLQVSLRIWDEQLWSQSSAFEQQALKRIREDDVNVARAVRAVLWRILPDAGCPHDELAGSAAWRPDAVKARSAVYDRVREELALPVMLTTMPSVVTGMDASATLPLQNGTDTGFTDTHPVSATGFHETRPVPPLHGDTQGAGSAPSDRR